MVVKALALSVFRWSVLALLTEALKVHALEVIDIVDAASETETNDKLCAAVRFVVNAHL